MIKHDIKNFGALFARQEGKENAAAENRVDESGGVAGEEPAVAGETALAIGKIRARIGRRDATGTSHTAGQEGLFGDRFFEELFGRFFRLPDRARCRKRRRYSSGR